MCDLLLDWLLPSCAAACRGALLTNARASRVALMLERERETTDVEHAPRARRVVILALGASALF